MSLECLVSQSAVTKIPAESLRQICDVLNHDVTLKFGQRLALAMSVLNLRNHSPEKLEQISTAGRAIQALRDCLLSDHELVQVKLGTLKSELLSDLSDFENDDHLNDSVRKIARIALKKEYESAGTRLVETAATASSIVAMLQESTRRSDLESFYTPKELSDFVVDLAELKERMTVYDPTCGIGTLLESARGRQPELEFFGQEINPRTAEICRLNLGSDHSHQIRIGDTLIHPLTRQTGFPSRFDRVIANLPAPPKKQAKKRGRQTESVLIQGQMISSQLPESAFVAHILDSLNQDGRGVFLVQNSFLFRRQSRALRQHMIDQLYLGAVISLPQGVLPYSKDLMSILVVSREMRRRHPVLMVDATQDFWRPEFRSEIVHTLSLIDQPQANRELQPTKSMCWLDSSEALTKSDYSFTPRIYIGSALGGSSVEVPELRELKNSAIEEQEEADRSWRRVLDLINPFLENEDSNGIGL